MKKKNHAKVGPIQNKKRAIKKTICVILKGLLISYLPLEQGDFKKTLALLFSFYFYILNMVISPIVL